MIDSITNQSDEQDDDEFIQKIKKDPEELVIGASFTTLFLPFELSMFLELFTL